MAKQRAPSKLELAAFEERAHKVDVFRATEAGISHLSRKEQWGNDRKSSIYRSFAAIVRATFRPNKKGVRLGLEQGGAALAAVAVEVHNIDLEVIGKAKAKAQAQAKANEEAFPVQNLTELADALKANQPTAPEVQ